MSDTPSLPGKQRVSPGLLADIREKWWMNGGSREPALREIALHVRPSKSLAIMGPSGVGKTTLLKVLAGLDTWFEGDILVDGDPVFEPDSRIQIVFQDNRLFEWMSVRDNVCFVWKAPKATQHELAEHWLCRIGLAERLHAYPRDLSEGQKKRVALARALVRPPRVLLLDEPLSGLDMPTAQMIARDLKRLQVEYDFACVVTTHSREEAVSLCESALFLIGGHPAIASGLVEFGIVRDNDKAKVDAMALIGKHLGL